MWIIVLVACGSVLLCSADDFRRTGCQGEFLRRCRCGQVNYETRQKVYVTNCTNSKFANQAMLEELPPETEVLIFTGNHITSLIENIFGSYEIFDRLKVLDFSNNNIKKIRNDTFDHQVHNVIELNLSDNLWRINDEVEIFLSFESLQKLILNNAFNKSISTSAILKGLDHQCERATYNKVALQNLSEIHLERNLFEHFNDDSFMCYLPSLTYLYLTYNRITHFTISRRCSHSLQFLDISGNFLKHLSHENLFQFNLLTNLQINIGNNPFFCDCAIKNTTNWLQTTSMRILDKEKYKCYESFPAHLKGKPLLAVEDKDLQCIPVSPPEENYSRAGIVILAVVLAIAAGLAAGLIYLNRVSVKRCLHLSTEPILRKFEYSSIGRREENEVDV